MYKLFKSKANIFPKSNLAAKLIRKKAKNPNSIKFCSKPPTW